MGEHRPFYEIFPGIEGRERHSNQDVFAVDLLLFESDPLPVE